MVTIGFVVASCMSKESRFVQNDGISGVYVREYSFKVVNPEGGNEIGIASIRDTIFVQQQEKDYQVKNSKWRLNDYDKEGWQNMEHADDRPMLDHVATFQSKDSVLVADSFPTIYLNGFRLTLYNGKKGRNPYQMVPPPDRKYP